jgi:hypothetical protein
MAKRRVDRVVAAGHFPGMRKEGMSGNGHMGRGTVPGFRRTFVRLSTVAAVLFGLLGAAGSLSVAADSPAGAASTTTGPSAAAKGDAVAQLAGPGGGYWLAASDGGLFAFGDAGFYGSMGGQPLNKPIVGLTATPDGKGYWEVASDGGLFAFGDAGFYGSTGGIALNKPIVGMAVTPDGGGYWLVASDGGIFAFGDAGFYGSTGGIALNKPIVGMTATPDGGGYTLVASDGGIFAFGDAGFHGSTGGTSLNKPIVGMAGTLDGDGYWLVASDGGIFAFGDATFDGSTGGIPLNAPVIGMAVAPVRSVGTLISPHNDILGVSCPTITWCAAVDGAGNVITYSNGSWSAPHLVNTDGEGFTGISCPTTTFCMAVSYLNGYTIYNGTSWSPMTMTPSGIGGGLWGVSCSSPTFCGIESDDFGDTAYYINGVWSQPPSSSDGEGINGIGLGQGSTPVSCVGTFCMYVSNGGYSQTSNDGTDLSAPMAIPGQTGYLTSSVSCTSATYCVAVNTGAYTAAVWNGSGWTETTSFGSTSSLGLNAVSCVGTSCAAVDDESVYSSAGGALWSGATPFDTTGEPTVLSCATQTFCVSGDTSGYAYLLNPVA